MIKLKELGHDIKASLTIPYAFALALCILILMILFGEPCEEEIWIGECGQNGNFHCYTC